jgi:hypothetical protein
VLVCFFDVLSSRCEDEERTKRIYHHKTYLSLVCHCVKFEPQGKGMLMPEKVSESTMGLVGTFSTSKAVDAPSKRSKLVDKEKERQYQRYCMKRKAEESVTAQLTQNRPEHETSP